MQSMIETTKKTSISYVSVVISFRHMDRRTKRQRNSPQSKSSRKFVIHLTIRVNKFSIISRRN